MAGQAHKRRWLLFLLLVFAASFIITSFIFFLLYGIRLHDLQDCEKQYAMGLNPVTKECEVFVSPCLLPGSWKSCVPKEELLCTIAGNDPLCPEGYICKRDVFKASSSCVLNETQAPVFMECTKDDDCFATGCSGSICAAEHVASVCIWERKYDCFKTIKCGCIKGKCTWLETSEFNACFYGIEEPEVI